MAHLSPIIRHLWQCVGMLCSVLCDATRFLRFCLRSPAALAAENLFLRKQLALYQEGHVKPRRVTDPTRFTLIWLSHWFDWRQALTVVQPQTFKRWRRQGFRLFWCWPSCSGRPPIPVELQGLIRQMARDNLTWGQRRIANELRLKLGLRVSPRTVCKYMPQPLDRVPGHRGPSQRWCPFLRNHAQALIVHGHAMDLLTQSAQAVSARMRRFWYRWWGRSVPRGVQVSVPSDTVTFALLIDTRLIPAVRFAGIMEVIREDDRSPPHVRPSRPHNPCPATRAIPPEDTLDVCPAGGAGCRSNRGNRSAQSGKPLRTRASQAASLP